MSTRALMAARGTDRLCMSWATALDQQARPALGLPASGKEGGLSRLLQPLQAPPDTEPRGAPNSRNGEGGFLSAPCRRLSLWGHKERSWWHCQAEGPEEAGGTGHLDT